MYTMTSADKKALEIVALQMDCNVKDARITELELRIKERESDYERLAAAYVRCDFELKRLQGEL